jgi:hypothetical protein
VHGFGLIGPSALVFLEEALCAGNPVQFEEVGSFCVATLDLNNDYVQRNGSLQFKSQLLVVGDSYQRARPTSGSPPRPDNRQYRELYLGVSHVDDASRRPQLLAE